MARDNRSWSSYRRPCAHAFYSQQLHLPPPLCSSPFQITETQISVRFRSVWAVAPSPMGPPSSGRSICRAAARTCGALRPPLKEVDSESGATLARQRWIYTRPRGVLASLALPAPRKVDVDFYAHYYRILFFEKDLRR